MPEAPARSGARRLFLHCAGSATPPFDRQAERALVLASGDDVVCVPREIDPEYLGFLSSIGLGPSAANVVAVPERSGIGGSLAERILRTGGMVEQLAGRLGATEVILHPSAGTADVFALAQGLERVAGRRVRVHASPPERTAEADARHRMRERATALGIPVAPGEVAELPPFGRRRRDLEPLRAAIERQRRCTGRVVVRSALGAGGPTRFLIEPGGDDTDDVLARIALGSGHRIWLVEVMVEASVRATVDVLVEPGTGTVRLRGVSDRRLGRGLTPVGSRYPTAARSVKQMETWAAGIAASLGADGFSGPVSVDFVEPHTSAGAPLAFFSGARGRPSEASYALGLGERLAAAALVSGTVPTRAATFGRLRQLLGSLLYDPDRGSGIVPYATGWLDQGTCPVVALADDRLQASELFGRAQVLVAPRPVDSP
ncbi:MAG TPA: hypothetical protein VFT84_10680, partial [Gemmatimonadales bacterium]|nr:hypothetical protein [Gemmatimonadales bacterium]